RAAGDVPFALRSQRPGRIGEAGGDQRQLVGDRADRADAEFAGEALPFAARELAVARQHLDLGEARRAARRGDRPTVQRDAEAFGADDELPGRGIEHATGHRPAILDQADRDAPLGDAVDELLRAVERIDDPDAVAVDALRRQIDALLGE